MTHYDRLKRKRLGDILVDEDLVGRDDVIAALHEQQRTSALLSDILMEARQINEYDLARVIVEQYQAPFIDLRGYTLHRDLIETFPPKLLHAARVVPLDRFGKQMCFACQEIPNEDVANELKAHAPGGIYFYVASAIDVRRCLKDNAPLPVDEVVADVAEVKAAVSNALPIVDMESDSSWTALFDEADAAVQIDRDDE